MGYGARGRLWNVGQSEQERLSATTSQLRRLRRLTNRSHPGLTRGEAADLIERAELDRAERRKGPTTIAHRMFESVMRRAVVLANEAGDKWLEQNFDPLIHVTDRDGNRVPVHGAIGSAWITWPANNSPFRKWLREQYAEAGKDRLPIEHRYVGRLEGGLLVACEMAAFQCIRNTGAVFDVKLMVRGDA